MKKIGFLALCAIMSISMTFAQKADFTVDKSLHDFGKIQEEAGNVTCEFVVKNTGNAPLVISRVAPSCGCTTPEWTKEPIAPGATGIIKATYGAKGRPGPFSKTISVFTNAKEGAYILTIKGDVIPEAQTPQAAYPSEMGDLRLKKVYVAFLGMNNTQTRSETIEIYNQGKSALNLSFSDVPAYITVSSTPASLAPGNTGTITVSFLGNKVNDYGTINNKLGIVINGKKDAKQWLSVQSTIVDDFSKMTAQQLDNAPVMSITPDFLNFDNIKSAKSKTITVTNNGKSSLIIHKIKSTSDIFSIPGGKKEIKPGKSFTYTVSVNAAKVTKSVTDYLEISTNDPKNPLKKVRLIASVPAK